MFLWWGNTLPMTVKKLITSFFNTAISNGISQASSGSTYPKSSKFRPDTRTFRVGIWGKSNRVFQIHFFFAGCWFSIMHACFNLPEVKKIGCGQTAFVAFLDCQGWLFDCTIYAYHMQKCDFASPMCLKFQIERLRYENVLVQPGPSSR